MHVDTSLPVHTMQLMIQQNSISGLYKNGCSIYVEWVPLLLLSRFLLSLFRSSTVMDNCLGHKHEPDSSVSSQV